MISGRDGPTTVIARAFNVLGLVYVTLPVRIAIAGYLAFRRQWWHLAAFAGAVLLSEVLIGPLKAVYSRPGQPARWSPPAEGRSRRATRLRRR
jgi:undecaprenyl-diphosphatase